MSLVYSHRQRSKLLYVVFKAPQSRALNGLSHLPIPADEANTVSRIDTGVRECADLRLDDHGSYLARAREPAVSLPTGLAAPPIETIPTEITKLKSIGGILELLKKQITLSCSSPPTTVVGFYCALRE